MSDVPARLRGKVALVTGAGSGIGRAITNLFAHEGATVVAVARQSQSAEQWRGMRNIAPIQVDVTDSLAVENMVEDAQRRFGGIQLICNVAGINDLGYPLTETSDERWDNVMNLDLKAPFQICRKAIPGMIEQGGGAIVNIGSYAAARGNHGAAYTAAKAGLVGLSRSIAVAYGSKGVRCNVINPGGVRTDIGAHSGGDYHPEGFARFMDIVGKLPVNWICDPQDIASTALFLCSDEAKHVNGAVIAVDGGMSAC